MFRKQDFKKVDLLGSGKKNTKIYKVLHIHSGRYYALKEVEAKTLDKLNEYKEEAVQLFKAQNHPNIIQFYGYFFYETMYNTYRIGIVCEYIEHRQNLEYVFRKRKQMGMFWKQEEIEKMLISLISTLSHMQSLGLCHRDLKPANLFLLPSGEIKVIDFGESKDYFRDAEDGGSATTATIRGTPQYLSPILWKAHVVDGNSRFAKHNIYKSDVFSVGLLFYQLAAMEDVTGFNQKGQEYDGEKMIVQGINRLKQRYGDSFTDLVKLMLRFHENERPSFIELAKALVARNNAATGAGGVQREGNISALQITEKQGSTKENKGSKSGKRDSLQVQSRPMAPTSPSLGSPVNQLNQMISNGSFMSPKNGEKGGLNFGAQNNPHDKQRASDPNSPTGGNGASGLGTQIEINQQKHLARVGSRGHGKENDEKNSLGVLVPSPQARKLNQGAKAKSDDNFIGVPPNLTDSTSKVGGHADFDDDDEVDETDAHNNFLTQADLFKSYAEQNHLYCNLSTAIFWFEFGGPRIGRMSLDLAAMNRAKQRAAVESEENDPNNPDSLPPSFTWRLKGKYKFPFSSHFAQVFISHDDGYYLLGANGNNNSNLHYNLKTVKVKANMPHEKTFFAFFHHAGIIYTFGGYDAYDKVQLSSCEYYDMKKDTWHNSPANQSQVEYKLMQDRSQGSACLFDEQTGYIFGGYHRDQGTLNTIERFEVLKKKITKMDLIIPQPIRRFVCMKISTTKILLIGGLGPQSEELDSVFCFDLEKEYTIEQLDKIDRAGIIDMPIMLDQIGNLHLFTENNNGTSPPHHVVYSFLEYS